MFWRKIMKIKIQARLKKTSRDSKLLYARYPCTHCHISCIITIFPGVVALGKATFSPRHAIQRGTLIVNVAIAARVLMHMMLGRFFRPFISKRFESMENQWRGSSRSFLHHRIKNSDKAQRSKSNYLARQFSSYMQYACITA